MEAPLAAETAPRASRPKTGLGVVIVTILWIPHTPTSTQAWDGSRAYHLFRHLAGAHELHWITWRQSARMADLRRWGRWSSEPHELGTAHTVWLAPNIYRLVTQRYPRPWHLALNQHLFRRAIGRLTRRVR